MGDEYSVIEGSGDLNLAKVSDHWIRRDTPKALPKQEQTSGRELLVARLVREGKSLSAVMTEHCDGVTGDRYAARVQLSLLTLALSAKFMGASRLVLPTPSYDAGRDLFNRVAADISRAPDDVPLARIVLLESPYKAMGSHGFYNEQSGRNSSARVDETLFVACGMWKLNYNRS